MATSVETPASSFGAWLKTHQSNLLTDWGLQIQQAPELRPREDLQDHSFTHALEDFFDLILQQIWLPNDYRSFRKAISEGSLDAFTPDAACRLFLVLDRCILSNNVRIEQGAELSESILMEGVTVGENARLRKTIVDKHVSIPAGIQIGYDLDKDKGQFTVTPNGVVVIPQGLPIEA